MTISDTGYEMSKTDKKDLVEVAEGNQNRNHERKTNVSNYGSEKSENSFKSKKDRQIGDFTLLGSLNQTKRDEIDRVLPHWLRNPKLVKCALRSEVYVEGFSSLLDSKLIDILLSDGMHNLFPIQKAVIPEIIKGAEVDTRFRPRDICVATPTGSGKTLAYALSIVQCLSIRTIPTIRAIIILPVKELASQVYDVFCHFAKPYGLRVGKAFGVQSFISEQEELVRRIPGRYRSNVDILIATPGRLSDHISETKLDFSHLRFLVFDEADQLFFGDWVSLIARIQRHLMASKSDPINMAISPCFQTFKTSKSKSEQSLKENPQKQSRYLNDDSCEDFETSFLLPSVPPQRLLFSATLSSNPTVLQNIALYRPLLFTADGGSSDISTIGQYIRPSELKEQYIRLKNSSLKPLILHYILHKARKKSEKLRAMVFTCSIALTNKVTILLKSMSKGKYTVEGFSKGRGLGREKLAQDFRDGAINVLVSTDAMSRGIDLTDIDLVVSYDIPSSTTYIHRIGRTARAGREGTSIALVAEVEVVEFKRATKDVEPMKLEVLQPKLEKYEDRFNAALQTLATEVREHSGKNLPKSLRKKKGEKKVPEVGNVEVKKKFGKKFRTGKKVNKKRKRKGSKSGEVKTESTTSEAMEGS